MVVEMSSSIANLAGFPDESRIAKNRYSWENVLNEVKQRKYGFKRSREVECTYAKEKCKINTEWDSMGSYCKHVFLQCPFVTKSVESENGKTGRVVKYVKDDDLRPALTFCLNNFPYHLEEDIQHYVIWSTTKLSPEQCKAITSIHFPLTKHDVIISESPPHAKSVPTAHHVHVLVRSRRSGLCYVNVSGFDEETTYA